MAKIVIGGYMFRYPMGGMLSNTLQYIIGILKLGHDVYFVEKCTWNNSCFDPVRMTMSNKCLYGLKHVSKLLENYGLQHKWSFVDFNGNFIGLNKLKVIETFNSADLFIDYGAHGAWENEVSINSKSVLVDGEPGTTQMKMQMNLDNNKELPFYNFYYTVGQNVGNINCSVPTVNKIWRKIFHPVDCEQFKNVTLNAKGAYTTVMNWQSRGKLRYNNVEYGHKDMEFEKFLALPKKVDQFLEAAVAGSMIPERRLMENRWNIINAHKVTMSYDSFVNYIIKSKAEFSVCKNIFVETNSGWFSDRSAVYLACGKPVVLQETGISGHLPCGKGLFTVKSIDETVSAIEEINSNYYMHSKWAKEIANEFLDAKKVMNKFLLELNL